MIHIRCGDDILDRLRALDLGPAVKWCDPLCQGPTPAGLSAAAWHDVRARFIAGGYSVSLASVLRDLRSEDAALRGACDHDEIVLWFEADLFDQAILVRLLAWFADHGTGKAGLSLVCIGAHPAIARFAWLGQLDAGQLGALFPQRAPVTPAQLALAQRAWKAWRAPDAAPLQALAAGDTAALPFLAEAIQRHLAELPDPEDGLALTERLALDGIAAGNESAATLFRYLYDREERPWLGDLMFWHVLDRLARAPDPPIRLDGPPGWMRGRGGARETRIALSPRGQGVLAGKTRYMTPPRWVGGIRVGE